METEQCSECNTLVNRGDLYFATPCGTFCERCMEDKHFAECGVCRDEFDADDGDEEE